MRKVSLPMRNCYVTGGIFFAFGAWLLWAAIKAWKERDELKESWKRMISNTDNVQELHKTLE
ncbi:MAG TPA: hypothetical protein VHU84_04600, partial [Lacipirellulaceae bacterium]|nr:hypothetical protein [Lacipirellulaceae bacterium]